MPTATAAFTPRQQDLELDLPTFDTFEEERHHRKQRLAVALRCSVGAGSAKAWRDTSPPAIPGSPTTSGSTRSA